MITWSLVFMFITLATVAMCVLLWVKPNAGETAVSADGSVLGAGVQTRVESAFESPSEEECLAIVRQALRARNDAQVTAAFRPGKGGTFEVLRFLGAMERTEGKLDSMEWLSSMDANGLLLEGVAILTRKDDKTRNRLALLTPDEKGNWRVDFDAFARVVEPSWEKVLAGEAPIAKVRVFAANDSYFNGPFASDRDWDCFGLASPDHEQILNGYCRKDSPQAKAMERIMENENEDLTTTQLNRVVVELRRVQGASSRQFEISRVLAQDWVEGESAFDESFK